MKGPVDPDSKSIIYLIFGITPAGPASDVSFLGRQSTSCNARSTILCVFRRGLHIWGLLSARTGNRVSSRASQHASLHHLNIRITRWCFRYCTIFSSSQSKPLNHHERSLQRCLSGQAHASCIGLRTADIDLKVPGLKHPVSILIHDRQLLGQDFEGYLCGFAGRQA